MVYCFTYGNKFTINFPMNVNIGQKLITKMENAGYIYNGCIFNCQSWVADKNFKTIEVRNEILAKFNGGNTVMRRTFTRNYALKLKIKDIINADEGQLNQWIGVLKTYVNEVMNEDNSSHVGNAVSVSQESAWMDCFKFIQSNLCRLKDNEKMFELVFEYSLPGTVHERPDVLLITDTKVISLEFKRKKAPQIDDNKDDVAQAIRYKEWLEHHHKVTKDKNLKVESYLVCTDNEAMSGTLRGIDILTKQNFYATLKNKLDGVKDCAFIDEWLNSEKTEMLDMLKAIDVMYREGRIPYISDVNKICLDRVCSYIARAKEGHFKVLLLINGVPGAGKTAVGQSIVYEENKGGIPNAVYLSGNGPLVEVLQYQINKIGNNGYMGENAIQGMKYFKRDYFDNDKRYFKNMQIPQQSILVFDEAQRAWDTQKTKRGFSEPEGLLRVGDKIFDKHKYVVIIGLYGNGQVIHTGEESGLSLWREALAQECHNEWKMVVSDNMFFNDDALKYRVFKDSKLFLNISLRADFIDCSKWVEQAVSRNTGSLQQAKKELEELQKTSMRICVTRSFEAVKNKVKQIDVDHPDWNYGILISNFAEQSVIRKALPGWDIDYEGKNVVANGGYGKWFSGESMKLDKACTVYGSQGLELDCPVVIFGGDYVRYQNTWMARGDEYEKAKKKFENPAAIMENNYRVLLTRARKEMILLIPNVSELDETYDFNETYDYFVKMGMDVL